MRRNLCDDKPYIFKRGSIEIITAVVTEETVVRLIAITVDVVCDVDNGSLYL